MAEHTKVPWCVCASRPVGTNKHYPDELLADHAAFICKTVNHHEAFIKGLELIADIAEGSATVNSLPHIAKITRQLLSDAE